MNARRLIPATTAGAVTLGLLSLTGCVSESSAEDAARGSDRLAVTASFYPLQFLAQQIGGDQVTVHSLTAPGVEPHDLELAPRQAAELGEADLLLYLRGIQPAVDQAVAQSGAKNVVDAATLTTLEAHGTEAGPGHGHEDGHEDGQDGGHDGEAEEDGLGGKDPHIWLDPVRYAEVAKGVGAALAKADPDHVQVYKTNTAALISKLDTLDAAYRDGLANTTGTTFITTHAAFGYLAERYGLTQQAIVGIDPESEPSPARVKELGAIAERDKVTTVFFETLASDKTAKALAGASGLKTDVLDPVEGITDKSRGDDYLQVMRANLAALQKALGAP